MSWAEKLILTMSNDLQYKPVQHSVKLSDEAWAAALERAELERTTASEICERLLEHYLALEEKPPRYRGLFNKRVICGADSHQSGARCVEQCIERKNEPVPTPH